MATIAENWMKKGMEKGVEKGKLETARELIKQGVSSEIIFKSTGLSLKKINQIKKELAKH